MRLIMIGDGSLQRSLRQEVERLGVSAHVEMMGAVEASSVMAEFDALLVTSQYEGFPYVVLEAMSLGVLPFTSTFGGTGAMMRGELRRLILDLGDLKSAAAQILCVLRDERLVSRLRGLALSTAGEFSVDQMVSKTVRLYEEVALQNSCRGSV